MTKFIEIEFSTPFVDLDGISPAQRDVRLSIARQIMKFAPGASAARGVALGPDRLKFSRPNIARDETSMQSVEPA